MDVIIQSLGFSAGESLEAFIKEKLQTLNSDKIVRANVTLYLGHDSTGNNKICEIRLEVPGNDPFVKKCTEHFETSVSESIEVLSGMMIKEREKNLSRRQADAETIHDLLADAEMDANSYVDLEDVVKK